MASKKIINTDLFNVGNTNVEYTSILYVEGKKQDFNAYIKLNGIQVGIFMYKTAEQFHYSYNNPESVPDQDKETILTTLLSNKEKFNRELQSLTTE